MKYTPSVENESLHFPSSSEQVMESPDTMEKQLNGASSCQTVTCSQVGVKEESDGDSTAGHLHRFQVKFSSTRLYEYTIECDQPCTVLEAITLTENFKKKMNCSDENIVIQLGRKDKNYIFPTHFPCSCIKEGESLILSYKSEQVEAAQDKQDKTIQPRHKYSVFYIDTVGGLYTKQKKLFRNNAVKKFNYLCVYGEKGMTNYYNRAPDLGLMESRVLANYYHKALDPKKENFGKIHQSFSEAHRLENMIKLGESVCKVVVQNGATGTGFVLFDNYILTNAHILTDCIEGEKLKPGINVYVLFNYDKPEPHINYYYFQAHREVCYSEGELDYAILKLNLESQKQSTQTNEMKVDLPPGLLKRFGEAPTTGEACLIGHPAGQVKKIDPICIIEKENREQAVIDHFCPYKDKRFVVHIINELKEQGIESIMMGGYKADKVTTYNTFMYHGASGSPVFDAHGNVFGLHTGGYVDKYSSPNVNVIEYAQPVLTIFEHLVNMMIEKENWQSLLRVREEAQGNSKLYEVFESVLKGSRYEVPLRSILVKAEPADSDEPMDTN